MDCNPARPRSDPDRKEQDMRRLIVLTLAGLALAGCNTIEGFGRDMANAGDAISGAASDARTGNSQPTNPRCPPRPRNGQVGALC